MIARLILLLVAATASAQVSYFNEGFLRQSSAAQDRAYLGINGTNATPTFVDVTTPLTATTNPGPLVTISYNENILSNILYADIVASTNGAVNYWTNDATEGELYPSLGGFDWFQLDTNTFPTVFIVGKTNTMTLEPDQTPISVYDNMGFNIRFQVDNAGNTVIGGNGEVDGELDLYGGFIDFKTSETRILDRTGGGISFVDSNTPVRAAYVIRGGFIGDGNGLTNLNLLNATNNDLLIGLNGSNNVMVASNTLWLSASNLTYQSTNVAILQKVSTNESRSLVWTSSTNNLGTNVSAVTFYGALSGNATTATTATYVTGNNAALTNHIPIANVDSPGLIVTNGETQAITVSNNWTVDSTHYMSGNVSATTLTNAAGAANTIPIYDGNKAIGTLANGGTSTYLEGTTPPVYSIPPYVMQFFGAAGNPSASSTYHFGSSAAINFITASATHPQYVQTRVPTTGHITAVSTHWFVGGTLASAGTISLWVTNITAATSVALTGVGLTAITADAADTGLSFAVTAGDLICMRLTTPAWSPTVPTSVVPSALILVSK